MRKLVVLSFMTLDGVIQAPGGPEEDTSGGFRFGGWTYPYFDEFAGNEMISQMGHDFDLLLGRKTYEIFAGYWPHHERENDPISSGLNKARKYVVSRTLSNPQWKNSIVINENAGEEIRKIKSGNGPEIQVHGSGNLIQTLWKHDLVDELWLKIFPLMLGTGKRLVENGSFSGSFRLIESKTSPSGVIIANYRREGDIKTGTIGD